MHFIVLIMSLLHNIFLNMKMCREQLLNVLADVLYIQSFSFYILLLSNFVFGQLFFWLYYLKASEFYCL